MIKRSLLALILLLSVCCLFAESDDQSDKRFLASVNPLAIPLGVLTGHFEAKIHDSFSLFADPMYFNIKIGIWEDMVAMLYQVPKSNPAFAANWDSLYGSMYGLGIGANFFPQGSALGGLFVGGSIQPAYMTAGFTGTGSYPPVSIEGFLIGAELDVGYRWIWDWFALDLSAGVAYSYYSLDMGELYQAAELSGDTLALNPLKSGFSPAIGLSMNIAF